MRRLLWVLSFMLLVAVAVWAVDGRQKSGGTFGSMALQPTETPHVWWVVSPDRATPMQSGAVLFYEAGRAELAPHGQFGEAASVDLTGQLLVGTLESENNDAAYMVAILLPTQGNETGAVPFVKLIMTPDQKQASWFAKCFLGAWKAHGKLGKDQPVNRSINNLNVDFDDFDFWWWYEGGWGSDGGGGGGGGGGDDWSDCALGCLSTYNGNVQVCMSWAALESAAAYVAYGIVEVECHLAADQAACMYANHLALEAALERIQESCNNCIYNAAINYDNCLILCELGF